MQLKKTPQVTDSAALSLRVRQWLPWLPPLVVAVIPILYFELQGRVGLSQWDEGYLWYGVQRVLAGEVPLRDFQSYDVVRYYFSAAIMGLLNNPGVLALRATDALLQAMAVALGTFLVARRSATLALPLLAGISMYIWMYPDFKAADFLAPLVLIAAFVLVIENPRSSRYFACGVLIGLVAMIGRNHGVYGVVASGLVFLYLFAPRRFDGAARAFAYWLAGVVAGYSPMLVMLAVTPGLAKPFFEDIVFLFHAGATNIALPIPKPWHVPIHLDRAVDAVVTLRELAESILIVSLPVLGLAAVATAFARRVQGKEADAVFVAAAMLCLPYAQYTWSRADVDHLAFGILPFVVVIVTFPGLRQRARLVVAVVVLATSALVLVPARPGVRLAREGGWPTVDVLGDRLLVQPDDAARLALLSTLVERYAPGDTPFLAVPYWPGAAAVFNRRSPMRDIYPLVNHGERDEWEEIERIRRAAPGFVIIDDSPLNRRDELRFRVTHPLIDAFVRSHFEPVTDIRAPLNMRVYRRPR